MRRARRKSSATGSSKPSDTMATRRPVPISSRSELDPGPASAPPTPSPSCRSVRPRSAMSQPAGRRSCPSRGLQEMVRRFQTASARDGAADGQGDDGGHRGAAPPARPPAVPPGSPPGRPSPGVVVARSRSEARRPGGAARALRPASLPSLIGLLLALALSPPPAVARVFQRNGDGSLSAISTDGRFVVFGWGGLTPGNPDPACSNDVFHVFVLDTVSGTTTCVSVSSTGAPANGDSGGGTISADGSLVAFRSRSTNLDPACAGNPDPLFVRNRAS